MSKIYPKHIEGRFRQSKNLISVLLQLVLFVTPWVTWNQRPILNVNLAERKLHLLGSTYWPQETHFLLLLLLSAGVGLFLMSAVLGRIWCGFACPQTLLSHAFIMVERFFEGDAYKRVRLDAKPWSEKLPTKIKTWTVWLVMSVYLGITFAGYFTPIREVMRGLTTGTLNSFSWGLILFFTVVALLFFGIIRSRFCTTICPYARFQSALTTDKTRMVNYDKLRGEPRGKAKDPEAADCVDCQACVAVCPMGIDIRDGFQFSCINCASCIDACDQTMDKVGRERGLVRFASLSEIDEGAGHQWTVIAWLQSLGARPLVYVALLAVLGSLFAYFTVTRPAFDFEAMREGSVSTTFDGRIANRYTLRVVNRSPQEKTIDIRLLEAPPGVDIVTAENPFPVGAEEVKTLELMVLSPTRESATSVPITFQLQSEDTTRTRRSNLLLGVDHVK